MLSRPDNPNTRKHYKKKIQWTYKVFPATISPFLNSYAFLSIPITMPKLVHKEESKAFSREVEKLTAIKDSKMPIANFIKRILIGQVEQFSPGTTAPK